VEDPFARLAELTRQVGRSGALRDAESAAAESAAVQSELAARTAVAATATDPGGMVEASVKVDGTVDHVHILPHAIRYLSDEELEAACADAIRAARAAAAAEVAAWLQPGEGTDDAGNGWHR
jgi:DNA-binding protein YbaB